MPPPPASGFRPTVLPPHRACAARSASHDPTPGHLSSWPRILADIPHQGIYSGKVNMLPFRDFTIQQSTPASGAPAGEGINQQPQPPITQTATGFGLTHEAP